MIHPSVASVTESSGPGVLAVRSLGTALFVVSLENEDIGYVFCEFRVEGWY